MDRHVFTSDPPTFVPRAVLQAATAEQTMGHWVVVNSDIDPDRCGAFRFDNEDEATDFAGMMLAAGHRVWQFIGIRIPTSVPFNPISPERPPLVLELADGTLPSEEELFDVRQAFRKPPAAVMSRRLTMPERDTDADESDDESDDEYENGTESETVEDDDTTPFDAPLDADAAVIAVEPAEESVDDDDGDWEPAS